MIRQQKDRPLQSYDVESPFRLPLLILIRQSIFQQSLRPLLQRERLSMAEYHR